MKLKHSISVVNNTYRVEINTKDVTAVEAELIKKFGYPVVQIGGYFSGSQTRPNVEDPTIMIAGDGSGAELQPIISGSEIIGCNIVAPGENYTIASLAVQSNGTGEGAELEPVLQDGMIIGVTILNGGKNYKAKTVTTYFSYPEKEISIPNNLPIVKVFDMGDYKDADIMASIFCKEMVDRIEASIQNLRQQETYFEGEVTKTI